MDFIEKFRKFVKENNLLSADDTVILGLSGGADSMCLLFLLKQCGVEIKAVHIHHGIRGAEADADEAFVSAICEKWEVPLCVEHHDIPLICKKTGESEEECGRRIRYEVFVREAGNYPGSKIAVAHHKNDQAETILFNLFRGTGIRGLCGMKAADGNIIRPLLGFARFEIEKFVEDNKIPFVTDNTNLCQEYSRNCIRGNIIPKAEELNSRAVEHICQTTEKLRDIEEYLNVQVEKTYAIYVNNDTISADLFKNEPPVIYKEVIRLAIKNTAGRLKDITAEHVQAVCGLCCLQTGRRLSLPYGITAVREYEGIHLINGSRDIKAVELPNVYMREIAAETVSLSNIPNSDYTKWFDCDKIKVNTVLRHRRKGDVIAIKTPKGTGHQSIQDFFTRQKIAACERDSIPLLADGENILWVVGYRVSEDYKVTENTKHILEVSLDTKL